MNEQIKSSSFSSIRKQLTIEKNKIQFNDLKINLEEISEFKYGLKAIRLEMFTIGRKYILDMKSPTEQFQLVLKSYFGLSRNYFNQIFSQALDEIWEPTVTRLINTAIHKIATGESVVVGHCTLSVDGVSFKEKFIDWNNLIYQKNYNRLTLNHKSDSKIWTNLYYLETYNVDIILGVLSWKYQNLGVNNLPLIIKLDK